MFRRKAIYGGLNVSDRIFDWTNIVRNDRERRYTITFSGKSHMHNTPLSGISADALNALLDDAFGTDRHLRTAYLLRKGMAAIDHLSFGILDNGELLASIQCWPVRVGKANLILVGPVAVATHRQSEGLGKRLMQLMLNAATPQDAPMVMIGDPEYYGRFGFEAEGTSGWTLPGPWEPRRLLLRNSHMVALPPHDMLGPAD
jgi:predicted N-acetyltransferase YhbS